MRHNNIQELVSELEQNLAEIKNDYHGYATQFNTNGNDLLELLQKSSGWIHLIQSVQQGAVLSSPIPDLELKESFSRTLSNILSPLRIGKRCENLAAVYNALEKLSAIVLQPCPTPTGKLYNSVSFNKQTENIVALAKTLGLYSESKGVDTTAVVIDCIKDLIDQPVNATNPTGFFHIPEVKSNAAPKNNDDGLTDDWVVIEPDENDGAVKGAGYN